MRMRSLESRIVILFLGLILVVQLASFFAIRTAIQNNARATINDELIVYERVFLRLLDQYAERLTQSARLLASDYGFRQALATGDQETITSVLANHGRRISASHAALIGIDRDIRASTSDQMGGNLEQIMLKLVAAAETRGSASGTGIMDGRPYKIVLVPVQAPITIGWVAMTFPIDQQIATDMKALSSLQVSILTGGGGETGPFTWLVGASTLPEDKAAVLAERIRDTRDLSGISAKLEAGDSEFSSRVLAIAEGETQKVVVALQRSLTEAIAPYNRLQLALLILTAAGIVLAFLGSVVMSRRITGPLRKLGDTARSLGAGNYHEQIDTEREDEIGELARAFAHMRDGIANRELEIRRLAYWDPLTDLPNRAQFTSLLEQAIATAGAEGKACHVLMLDLDRFKTVNDVLGQAFGDALLRKVGERLEAQLDLKGSNVARLGGDEFAVLLPNTPLDNACAIAARIVKSLEEPFQLDEQNVDLGAGIGIAGFPAHASDPVSLMSRAEVAMYAAKGQGNPYVVYEQAIDRSSQQNLSLLGELRHAIDGNEFRLYVQPKVALDTGHIIGAETLVRWSHPEKGMIFPDSFIPFAEKTGFIRSLSQWMLDHAAELAGDLARAGMPTVISVNLSARDLLDQDLPAKLASTLAHRGVSPSLLCLEITESAMMDDPLRAQQTLAGIHGLGIDLAIDDFGTGYSSLAYLKRLPVHELKIDKSFTLNMERNVEDAKIVRSTIDLGHNLGLRVVAEGVETLAVWRLLQTMGCDQGQGYYISKPMPGERFAEWLKSWQPPASGPHADSMITAAHATTATQVTD